MNEKIKQNMNRYEQNLSIYACKNSEAYRIKTEEEDIRPPFFRDIDRIIYSLSYSRYQDKTQVFSFNDSDHISKRMTHVQMVSKVARTIGRALGLNEDLIEAASLGHDLGHVPFGHVGEHILSEISERVGVGYFNHNIQSVRNLMYLELNGKGRNLNIQVLDAIMCHNGEMVLGKYYPKQKTTEEFLEEYHKSYTDSNLIKKLRPMTLEGCVVRISDFIAYVGQDIEDAIRVGILKRENLPQEITKVLGNNNRDIIDTIVTDVIENSCDFPYIKMSDKIFNAIKNLKDFNYKFIYSKANSKEELTFYKKIFNTIFNTYLKDLQEHNLESDIYKIYLNNMSETYKEDTTNERKVIDYIAGMTDDFILIQYKKITNN